MVSGRFDSFRLGHLESATKLWRVRFVLADVSSIKTTRSGRADTAGMRCTNQSYRRRLTLFRAPSAGTSDCLIRILRRALLTVVLGRPGHDVLFLYAVPRIGASKGHVIAYL